MPWCTKLKPGETLIVKGVPIRAERYCRLAVLDDTKVTVLDENGNHKIGPQPQEANQ